MVWIILMSTQWWRAGFRFVFFLVVCCSFFDPSFYLVSVCELFGVPIPASHPFCRLKYDFWNHQISPGRTQHFLLLNEEIALAVLRHQFFVCVAIPLSHFLSSLWAFCLSRWTVVATVVGHIILVWRLMHRFLCFCARQHSLLLVILHINFRCSPSFLVVYVRSFWWNCTDFAILLCFIKLWVFMRYARTKQSRLFLILKIHPLFIFLFAINYGAHTVSRPI